MWSASVQDVEHMGTQGCRGWCDPGRGDTGGYRQVGDRGIQESGDAGEYRDLGQRDVGLLMGNGV